MVEKTDAVDVSGTSEFDSTARFRVKNNLIRQRLRPCLIKFQFDRTNAVESDLLVSDLSTVFIFSDG